MSSSTAEQQYDAVYLSPIGWLGIRLQGQQLKQLAWLSARPVVKKVENRRLRIIMDALHRYFSAAQDFPTLPVAPEGTVFQRRVWAALQDIPCGQAGHLRPASPQAEYRQPRDWPVLPRQSDNRNNTLPSRYRSPWSWRVYGQGREDRHQAMVTCT